MAETNEQMIARTRKRLDELVAHLDEGGAFSAQNVLELIADAQDLGNRLQEADVARRGIHEMRKDFRRIQMLAEQWCPSDASIRAND